MPESFRDLPLLLLLHIAILFTPLLSRVSLFFNLKCFILFRPQLCFIVLQMSMLFLILDSRCYIEYHSISQKYHKCKFKSTSTWRFFENCNVPLGLCGLLKFHMQVQLIDYYLYTEFGGIL